MPAIFAPTSLFVSFALSVEAIGGFGRCRSAMERLGLPASERDPQGSHIKSD